MFPPTRPWYDIYQGLICAYIILQMMKASSSPSGMKNIYLHSYKIFKNQTWQNKRPVYTDFTLQVLMIARPLDHMTNIYSFITTFMSAITTKLGRILN